MQYKNISPSGLELLTFFTHSTKTKVLYRKTALYFCLQMLFYTGKKVEDKTILL